MIAPEFQILILNAAIMGVAYGGIFPSLKTKTAGRMMAVDAALITLSLTVVGALFWGSGTRFSLLFVETNWVVFTLLTAMAIETPLFFWFCKRYDINFFD